MVQIYRKWSLIGLVAMILGLLAISPHAQGLPVFRIGVLDSAESALTRGAQLAVQEINAAGGVVGADGTVFQLQLVIQPIDDIQFALANIRQASVIAIIGPADSQTAMGNRDILTSLNVPVLTTATDDTLIASDTSNRFMRLRATEGLQGRALADYLIRDLSAASLETVQLDIESTVSMIGFSQASSQLGLPPLKEHIVSEGASLQNIMLDIVASRPQFVVAYGPPLEVANLYTDLRENEWFGRFVYNQADNAIFRDNVQEGLLEGVVGVSTWSYTFGDNTSQDFVFSYIRAFGELPDDLAAAAYDGVYLLHKAIGQPGNLQSNLLTISSFEGVQGILNPAGLSAGETSDNVSIFELGEFSAPFAVARFSGIQRITLQDPDFVGATATPLATSTPEGVYLVVTRAVQNVRSGPSLNYDIIGQLQEGDTASIVGATIDFAWVAIDFRGTLGWLSRGILDIQGDTVSVPILTPPPSPTPLPVTATPTAQPIPDIVIVSTTPNRLVIGEIFNVIITVRNQGGGNAGLFAIAASFEPGNIYAAQNLQGLSAGSQVDIALSGVLSGGTGLYNVTIIADLNDQVVEGAGEANNSTFIYSYIADAPLLKSAQAIGTITLNELGVAVLDGGSQDIQWGGGGIVPLGATQIGILNGFASANDVHRDAIANTALANGPITNVSPGMLIGIHTDTEGKYGLIQIVSAQAGGQIVFNYRMYDS